MELSRKVKEKIKLFSAYRKAFPSRELARFGLALRFHSASVAHERHESSGAIPCESD